MKRIAILGNLGGGKSTPADGLGEALDLPVVHLDARHDQGHWDAFGEDEAEFEHDQILLHDEWIIEGFGSWWTIERRLAAADTAILIDLPVLLHVDRALRRQLRCLPSGPPPPQSPQPLASASGPPCPSAGPWTRLAAACRLIRKVRDVHQHTLPRLRIMLASAGSHLRRIRLTSQHAIDTFLARHGRRCRVRAAGGMV